VQTLSCMNLNTECLLFIPKYINSPIIRCAHETITFNICWVHLSKRNDFLVMIQRAPGTLSKDTNVHESTGDLSQHCLQSI
jgi:hypothetical protein